MRRPSRAARDTPDQQRAPAGAAAAIVPARSRSPPPPPPADAGSQRPSRRPGLSLGQRARHWPGCQNRGHRGRCSTRRRTGAGTPTRPERRALAPPSAPAETMAAGAGAIFAQLTVPRGLEAAAAGRLRRRAGGAGAGRRRRRRERLARPCAARGAAAARGRAALCRRYRRAAGARAAPDPCRRRRRR